MTHKLPMLGESPWPPKDVLFGKYVLIAACVMNVCSDVQVLSGYA